jgi:hypothetical protein
LRIAGWMRGAVFANGVPMPARAIAQCKYKSPRKTAGGANSKQAVLE